jgi:hypothetical protein
MERRVSLVRILLLILEGLSSSLNREIAVLPTVFGG